jgi:PPOX class probable F420-dependent enzyme
MSAIPESHRYLLDAPVAILSTVGPDGRPQSSVLWFAAVDGTVKLSLHPARQKTKNLQANPVASLLILDTENTGKYLELRGDVTIEPDPEYAFADAHITPKYGLDLRVIDGDNPGQRVVVTLNPVRVNAVDMGR